MNQTKGQPRPTWQRPWFRIFAILGVCAIAIWIWSHYCTDVGDQDPALARATWAVALFTFVLGVGIPATLWDSASKALEQEEDLFYAQLDNMYLQIQKLIIEHPHLGNPAVVWREGKTDHLIQYDAFAFVVWNFIESIHDFTHKGDGFWKAPRKTEMLTQTWDCIIKYEGMRHAEWFLRPDNEHKFKPSFRKSIIEKLGIGATTPPASAT